MAGGVMNVHGAAKDYGGGITAAVILTCFIAASGGLIYGYDIGITGGVTTMEPFLKTFFPGILEKMKEAKQDEYCVYNSQVLTAFTSSLYIAGLVASIVAGRLTKAVGRQAIMVMGGTTFFVGSALNGGAVNVAMLILGRLLLGVGVGFVNQATPVYLAETAPAKWRGGLSTGFELFIGIGIVASNLTNYETARIARWGWRLSLGLATVPAALIFLGSFFISDTPSSLIQRGKLDEARAALRRIRGRASDIEAEIRDIQFSVEESNKVEQGAYRRILQRRYRPYLVIAVAIPVFQQFTGVIVLAFFAPVLFRTVGFGGDSSLMGSLIIGLVNLVWIVVSAFLVDRVGRKVLLLLGGAQMIISQVGVAWILAAKMGPEGEATLPRGYALAVLLLLCGYSAAFGWSWGPLNWIITSEVFPVEVRSVGQSISVAANVAATFVQTQVFLAMLCVFKEGVFGFYTGCVVVMSAFVALFLPETKGVPLESMDALFKRHWYWGRFLAEVKEHPGGGRGGV